MRVLPSADASSGSAEPVEELGAQLALPGELILRKGDRGDSMYFISSGASPKGDQPFVGVMPVGGGEEKILYRSSDPYYDEPTALLSPRSSA